MTTYLPITQFGYTAHFIGSYVYVCDPKAEITTHCKVVADAEHGRPYIAEVVHVTEKKLFSLIQVEKESWEIMTNRLQKVIFSNDPSLPCVQMVVENNREGCISCGGQGYTAEHGCDGTDENCAVVCPIQVQCQACRGEGSFPVTGQPSEVLIEVETEAICQKIHSGVQTDYCCAECNHEMEIEIPAIHNNQIKAKIIYS